MHLADTSAWWVSRRDRTGDARRRFDELTVEGTLAICDIVRFELLYSVRNHDEFAVVERRLAVLPDSRSGATILHHDEDFDRIAAITGQPTQWIVPRGSL
jgi:predicted nucleic acid-binding protein